MKNWDTLDADDMDPLTGTIVSSAAWSRLAVQHLSRQVEGPWNSGSEPSSPDPAD